MKKYVIKPTLAHESLESWVWTNDNDVILNSLIVIENPTNNKKIITFKRTIDNNFVTIYNQANTIPIILEGSKIYLILNEYYRNQLKLNKNSEIDLIISKANFLDKVFAMALAHPNPTVQFANRSAIFSIVIGIIALVLTIYSIYITLA